MIDVLKLSEEDLGPYWLQVWRCFIEEYWNWLRTPDEDNDPYWKNGIYGKPHYTFKSLREDKCKPNEVIDAEVADLASNFWKRNRSYLKEYFINWTCEKWNTNVGNVLAVDKDVVYNGWIDCGVDPSYPNRRLKYRKQDADELAKTGELQEMLEEAKFKACVHIWREECKQERIKAHRKRKARWRLLKMKIKKLFKKALFWLKI